METPQELSKTQLYNKNYYRSRKEKNPSYTTQKMYCDVCDREYSKTNFSKHLKRAPHKRKMKLKEAHGRVQLTQQIIELLNKLGQNESAEL